VVCEAMAQVDESNLITTEEVQVKDAMLVLRRSWAAKKTLPEDWRRGQLIQLQKMLTENRAQFVKALHEDLHKSEVEGYYTEMNLIEHEIQHLLDELHELMQPEKVNTNIFNVPGWSRIYKDPLGVVMVMGVWNYPIQLTLLPVVGAIAAGNCVLIKVPSVKYSKSCSAVIATLCAKYMDQDCIRVVQGDRVMNQAVMKERFDKIFFTGGAKLGAMVCEAAARHLTPCALELGGKSPAIVCPSADIPVAARRITWGAFLNSGQTCVRPDYVCVHASVAEQFLQEVKKCVKDFYGEDPQKSEYFGRIINGEAHTRLKGVLKEARESKKATILLGGEDVAEDRYIAPTILDYGEDEEAFQSSGAMADELFGPIMPVFRFRDLQRVVDYVRQGEKPLSVYPFTTVAAEQELILRETSSGGCDVNDVIMRLSNPDLPFGGVGQSGMGEYHGRYSFMAFSHRKSVSFKTNYLDLPVRYPPYVSWKVAVLSVVQQVHTAQQMRSLKAVALIAFTVFLRRLGWPSDLLTGLVRLLLGRGQSLHN